ncbi:hypothetical protein MUP51_08690, partial [Candidatus Bathyarchaeota archaeon]|nr:hypothetical protein [Candidatus Bathyarchaeota archaeon]
MEQNQLIAIVLVAGLLVGGGVGYVMAPKNANDPNEDGEQIVIKGPLEGVTVKYGDIYASTAELETGVPLAQDIIMADINAMTEQLGYDVTFEALIDESSGQAATHLEKVQGFKSMDINLIIGGR